MKIKMVMNIFLILKMSKVYSRITFIKKISYACIFLLFPINVLAQEMCTKDKSFCLETIKNQEEIEFIAKNNVYLDLTTTIMFSKLLNADSEVKFPYTFVIKGKSKKNIFTLKPKVKSEKLSYKYYFHASTGNFMAKHDNNYEYTLPYQSGEEYKVIQGYDGDYSHQGEQEYSIDFGMPEGTDVLACRDGKIVSIKNDSDIGGADKSFSKHANLVIIEHSDKTLGAYLHLLKGTVLVKIGQYVKAGQLIAKSGNTGWSSAPHLHFCVYKAKDGFLRQSIPVKFKISPNESDVLYEDEVYKAF